MNKMIDLCSMDFKLNYNYLKSIQQFSRKKDANTISAWSMCVGKGFLDSFGLGELDSTYCLSGQEQQTQTLSCVKQVNSACREPGMPFPVLNCYIAAVGAPNQFHCYEFTPLYSGCPTAKHDSSDHGGVLLEPFGACSQAPESALPSQYTPVTMHLDVEWTVPLA